jgi:hypothetical protein
VCNAAEEGEEGEEGPSMAVLPMAVWSAVLARALARVDVDVAKDDSGPPPPSNPLRGAYPSASPHVPRGQRSGESSSRAMEQTPPSYLYISQKIISQRIISIFNFTK